MFDYFENVPIAREDSEVAISYDTAFNAIVAVLGEKHAEMAEICLSVILTVLLEGHDQPVGVNFVGPSGCGKTTVLKLFTSNSHCLRRDKFTVNAFVTCASNVSEEDRRKIDLLPKMKDKCLILPELGGVISQPSKVLIETFGTLATVFDGDGMLRASGTRDVAEYDERIMFSWLGAMTNISNSVWDIMLKVGARMLFVRFPVVDFDVEKNPENTAKLTLAREAVSNHIDLLFNKYESDRYSVSDTSVTRDVKQRIKRIAKLVTGCRTSIHRDKHDASDGRGEITYCTESPSRLQVQLTNIAMAHAMSQDRESLNESDYEIVARIALCSMHESRIRVLSQLLAEGEQTINHISSSIDQRHEITANIIKAFEHGDVVVSRGHAYVLNTDYDFLRRK